ncbi:MAG: carbon-nitrogen hydrolase family protein [Gemmatimonadetes bacterium]|nr:carbon-nitrogen hydrolase family protein [Gemmatimonadota bacterium]
MTLRRPGPRHAVIGTCTLSLRDIDDADLLLANGLNMIDEMAAEAERQGLSLDIVALPEHFALPAGSVPAATAEDLNGRTITAIAEKARTHGTYAVVPMYLRQGEAIHNSAVILDRAGEPAGIYHKAFPVVLPDESIEQGITPGSEFPVFETDFGRVGLQICWDAVFDDGWQALAEQEAELVIMPSAAPTLPLMISHAYRHQYYIASSVMRPPSVIVNPQGRIIAESSANRKVAVTRVDLDYRVVPSTFLWSRGDALKRKYGDIIDWNWHDAEGSCLMTSSDPDMPIGRFLEIEGIMTLAQWIAYNRQRIEAERGGPILAPSEVNDG